MTTLTSSSENLVSCLEKAEADLKFTTRCFEEEFHSRFPNTAANPFSILQRLKRLERELPSVREDCRAVLTAKQELVDKANRVLLANREALKQLEGKSGAPLVSNTDTFEAFSAAMHEWQSQVGFTLPGGKEEISLSNLNQALVNSVLVE